MTTFTTTTVPTCSALTEQPAQPQQEPVAWPCIIAEADFEKNTVTLEMQCSDYKVGAGQHWLSASPQPAQPQHPDDQAVDRFAAAMKDKLAKAREKGRGGWETCPPSDLSRMLREHVEKGDPRDVANFCMMLWSLGAGIAAQPQQEPLAWLYDWIAYGHEGETAVQDWISADYDEAHSPTMGCHNIRPLYTSPPAQRKPLTDAHARFAAQHQFLQWNRQQDEPLVKIAYEYGVAQKAIDLYIEAAHGIKEDA